MPPITRVSVIAVGRPIRRERKRFVVPRMGAATVPVTLVRVVAGLGNSAVVERARVVQVEECVQARRVGVHQDKAIVMANV